MSIAQEPFLFDITKVEHQIFTSYDIIHEVFHCPPYQVAPGPRHDQVNTGAGNYSMGHIANDPQGLSATTFSSVVMGRRAEDSSSEGISPYS